VTVTRLVPIGQLIALLQATYTFSLPYVYAVQTSGLSFPVHIWYDADNKRVRTDVYGGLDSTLTVEVSSWQTFSTRP
jgi:hypothetical protein